MRTFLLSVFGILGGLCSTAFAQSSVQAKAEFPSFFYQGDQPKLQFILHNTSAEEKTGNLQLELFDAVKKQPVDGWFYNQLANQYFTLTANERIAIRFPLTIPYLFDGNVHWQLTIRVDSTQQVIRGSFSVKATQETTPTIYDSIVSIKMSRMLLSRKITGKKIEEKNITAFSTQSIGQYVLVRIRFSLHKPQDSCIVQLPLSAGLQSTPGLTLLRNGKPITNYRLSQSDTATRTTFYGLVPGIYQWDYQYMTRYPGQFLVPACSLRFIKQGHRQLTTPSQTIEID
jgi:hypothetical protein